MTQPHTVVYAMKGDDDKIPCTLAVLAAAMRVVQARKRLRDGIEAGRLKVITDDAFHDADSVIKESGQ